METTLKVFAFCTLLVIATVLLSGQATTKQRVINCLARGFTKGKDLLL